METIIKVLPDELVNKIAAGEVVERPASVVKELIENAIDAKADEIKVDIKTGGRALIQVEDNGVGMSKQDAILCIERHATSKINSINELYNIKTLGFRGEALAAIASISKMEITTRHKTQDFATRIQLDGGILKQVDIIGSPIGTSMIVKDIFFNTPARLKFLKAPSIEQSHIVDVVTRLALSNDSVSIKLVHQLSTLLQTTKTSLGKNRLVEIFGKDISNHLYPFEFCKDSIRIYGYFSDPSVNRSAWTQAYTFINGRSVKDRLIFKAIADSYVGIIPKGRYPIVVIYIEINPCEVDVNVHPGKLEVRFIRPRIISEYVVSAIRSSLYKTPWVKSNISSFNRIDGNERLYNTANNEKMVFNDNDLTKDYYEIKSSIPLAITEAHLDPLIEIHKKEVFQNTLNSQNNSDSASSFNLELNKEESVLAKVDQEKTITQYLNTNNNTNNVDNKLSRTLDQNVSKEIKQLENLDLLKSNELQKNTQKFFQSNELLFDTQAHNFSNMRVIGQYGNSFIICQNNDELVMIDQHAAHERVTFEVLKAKYDGLKEHQLFVTPHLIDMSKSEYDTLSNYKEELLKLGIEIEPFGGNSIALKSLPFILRFEDPNNLLSDIAVDLMNAEYSSSIQKKIYMIIATIACHGSIRANRRMAHLEMESLLKDLDGTPFNFACPHGRPLVVKFGRKEIESFFKRT